MELPSTAIPHAELRQPEKLVKRIFRLVSTNARRKRASLFRSVIPMTSTSTVLDLGSGRGDAIHDVLAGTPVQASNVYIADISAPTVAEGARRYGYTPVVLSETGHLPFCDHEFDVVYCSSVIEHVTLPKAIVWLVTSTSEFHERATESQLRFAAEIRRVGRNYFVQTPNRHFPIESHSWLPFVNWLPRPALVWILKFSNRFWVKRTKPDFRLLSRRSLGQLFPDAEIRVERLMGMSKSLIAFKADRSGSRAG